MIDLAELRSLYTPEAATVLERPALVAAVFAGSLASSVLRYLSWSGGLYWWFYVKRRAALAPRKIQPAWPEPGQIRREIGWSLSSCVVYAAMTAALYVCLVHGWTRIYLNVSDRGWGYLALSLALMLV